MHAGELAFHISDACHDLHEYLSSFVGNWLNHTLYFEDKVLDHQLSLAAKRIIPHIDVLDHASTDFAYTCTRSSGEGHREK